MAGEMLIQVYETGADFMHTFLPDNLTYSIEIIFEYQKFLIETLQNPSFHHFIARFTSLCVQPEGSEQAAPKP